VVAATFVNQSFEDPEGSTATILSGSSEPFGLNDLDRLEIRIDGPDTGDVQSILFEIGTRSTITSANTEPFALADGQTLDVDIDGGAPVTVTFNTADFVSIGAATAIEVAAVLVTQLPGTAFAQVNAGAVVIGSLTKGTGSLIDVSGGTAAAAFAFPAGVAGVDYFADITAATAAEVAAVINLQLTDGAASDSTGQVQLETTREGADSCVEVIGGTAAGALNFPTGAFCGLTNPGFAQGWSLVSSASLWEFAEFSNGLEFPGAFETFTLGWPGSPGAEGDAAELDTNNFTVAIFATDQTVDDFGWFPDSTELPALLAAPFNAALVPTAFEAFDQGWPGVPGSEADSDTLGTLDDAIYNTTLDDVESFSREWNGNENDSSTLVGLTLWTVGQGGNAETFSPFTDVYTDVRVLLATSGERYQIQIQGIDFTHVATGGDTPTSIASSLAILINNGFLDASALAVGDRVEITNTATTPDPFEVGVLGSDPASIQKIFTDAVQPNIGWTGAEQNNYC
jgi:hypothetical protein